MYFDPSKENKQVISELNDITIGADPELFLSTADGGIVASEEVIPKNGIAQATNTDNDPLRIGKVVRDGIQIELNPTASTCRQVLAREIASCFKNVLPLMEEKGLKFNFSTAVKINNKDFARISDASKVLGCTPSFNLNKDLSGSIKVGNNHQVRSAGGHIHLGNPEGTPIHKALKDYDKMVALLDILVGNTSVMVDRDDMNAERRKVYGRAGEYRKPGYGIEYRTLSNFWLKSYPLMSMVFSLARDAVHVLAASTPENDFADRILKSVDKRSVDRAINGNLYMVAYRNFMQYAPIMQEITFKNGISVFSENNLPKFKYFIRKRPEHWFKEDPFEHWLKVDAAYGKGFEGFLNSVVAGEMGLLPPIPTPVGVPVA